VSILSYKDLINRILSSPLIAIMIAVCILGIGILIDIFLNFLPSLICGIAIALYIFTIFIVNLSAQYILKFGQLKDLSDFIESTKKVKEVLDDAVERYQKGVILPEKVGHRIAPIEEMEKIENEAQTVWVFSRALHQDEKWKDKIYQKVKNGCKYVYFIPPKGRDLAAIQFENLTRYWNECAKKEEVHIKVDDDKIEIGKGVIERHFVNPHCFFMTFLVYDAIEKPKVIIKFPSNLSEELLTFVIRLDPTIDTDDREAVEKIRECLSQFAVLECPLLASKHGEKI
jgi:hypothetical protein